MIDICNLTEDAALLEALEAPVECEEATGYDPRTKSYTRCYHKAWRVYRVAWGAVALCPRHAPVPKVKKDDTAP